jgi:hypothetical protein
MSDKVDWDALEAARDTLQKYQYVGFFIRSNWRENDFDSACKSVALALPAILAEHKRAEEQIAELRTIVDNVAAALYPHADKPIRDGEMMLDGMGAVGSIKTLRAAVKRAEEIREATEEYMSVAEEDPHAHGRALRLHNADKRLRAALKGEA